MIILYISFYIYIYIHIYICIQCYQIAVSVSDTTTYDVSSPLYTSGFDFDLQLVFDCMDIARLWGVLSAALTGVKNS